MMGTIYILLDGVFLLLLFAYLTRNTEAGKGFWSKAYAFAWMAEGGYRDGSGNGICAYKPCPYF